jgi:hypothetical protein
MIPASRARLRRGTDARLLFSQELSRRSIHTPTMVGDVGNAPHDTEARTSDRGLNFCVFDQLCIGNRGPQEDMRENVLHVCVGALTQAQTTKNGRQHASQIEYQQREQRFGSSS